MELRSGELSPLKVKWGSLSPGDSRAEVFSILCLRRDSRGIQGAPNRCHSLPSSTSSPASSTQQSLVLSKTHRSISQEQPLLSTQCGPAWPCVIANMTLTLFDSLH